MAYLNRRPAPCVAFSLDKVKIMGSLMAPNTVQGYRFDWRAFCRWCTASQLNSFPATSETVSLYIIERLNQGRKLTSVTRELAAISYAHRRENLPTPIDETVRNVIRGVRRMRTEHLQQALPLAIEDVRAISVALAAVGSPIALRDRALILVGFASALRGASLVALQLGDTEFTSQGMIVHVHREKQDQEGKGRLVGIPHGKHPETCAVKALGDWLAVRGDSPGPLFSRFKGSDNSVPLDPQRVGLIVQKCLRRIGRNPQGFSAHSLRSGVITELGLAGASLLLISTQSGHGDLTCLRRYFRRQNCFRSNPLALLDL